MQAARSGNAGIALDTWHLAKLGITAEQVRELPAGCIAWVELGDGTVSPRADHPLLEAFLHRSLPGEGELPIGGYVAAARGAGYVGPWGVEALSAELRAMALPDVLDRVVATTLPLLRASA